MGDRLATIDMGRKVGAVVPLSVLGESLAISVPTGILIHPAAWPRYTNVTDRQDRQDNGSVA